MLTIKERTFNLSIEIIELLKLMPKSFIFEVLGKQLLRSGTSVGANIAEAQAGSSKKDFVNYYFIALKSANESVYWLELLLRVMKHPTFIEKTQKILNETTEISKILGASVVKMKKNM